MLDELNKLKFTKLDTAFKDFPFYKRLETTKLKPIVRNLDTAYIKESLNDRFKKQFKELFLKVTDSLLSDTHNSTISMHIEPTFELELRRKIRAFSLERFKVTKGEATP